MGVREISKDVIETSSGRKRACQRRSKSLSSFFITLLCTSRATFDRLFYDTDLIEIHEASLDLLRLELLKTCTYSVYIYIRTRFRVVRPALFPSDLLEF